MLASVVSFICCPSTGDVVDGICALLIPAVGGAGSSVMGTGHPCPTPCRFCGLCTSGRDPSSGQDFQED